jgi:hypothetical protein
MDETEQRIARRAYQLWEAEGRLHGQEQDHWDRARFLIGLEDNADAGQLPNPSVPTVQNPSGTAPMHAPSEPLREAVENLGEFPGLTDQGGRTELPTAADAQGAQRRRRGAGG